jgi:hypothetical protein
MKNKTTSPQTLNICGTPYTLTYTTVKSDEDLADCYGVCHCSKQNIVIDKSQPVETLASTIRHEIIHAFLFECGLTTYAGNETLVEFLAQQFPKLLKLFQQSKSL